MDEQQRRLVDVTGNGNVDPKHFELVLGLTCHAIYHAGQVQLIKALSAKS